MNHRLFLVFTLIITFCIFSTMADKNQEKRSATNQEQQKSEKSEPEGPEYIRGSNMIGAGRHRHNHKKTTEKDNLKQEN
ncbi:unnamed protein product [Caenorhabditis angaria]|uniref:Uncharacterized protein n=1 Tax=Caenorhabditis angaria TaxID=860376 RepID=A0A9P1IVY8_9PELO|nr:unnamed protein product [Caenorhabditis angaria]